MTPHVRLLSLLVVAFLGSCSGPEFSDIKKMDENGWHKDNILVFEPEIADTSFFNLNLYVENTKDYSYANLWYFIDLKFPDGTEKRDTFEIFLADRSGKWLGNKTGDGYEREVTYRQGIKLIEPGLLQIKIQQGMRTDTLKNIVKTGVIIRK